jgi:hypothetical protein
MSFRIRSRGGKPGLKKLDLNEYGNNCTGRIWNWDTGREKNSLTITIGHLPIINGPQQTATAAIIPKIYQQLP